MAPYNLDTGEQAKKGTYVVKDAETGRKVLGHMHIMDSNYVRLDIKDDQEVAVTDLEGHTDILKRDASTPVVFRKSISFKDGYPALIYRER